MATPITTLPSFSTTEPTKLSIEELEQELATTKKTEKEEQKTFNEIKKQFDEVDKIIQEHATKWMEHLEDFIKELVQQLEEAGISLTAEEKAELKSGLKTISEIRNKIKNLKRMNIEIADNAAYYIVAAYDTLVTALSRLLQKIDNVSLKGIIKKLKILDKEKEDIKSIISTQGESYNKIITAVQKLVDESKKHAAPAQNIVEKLDNFIKTAEKPIIKQAGAPEVRIVLE